MKQIYRLFLLASLSLFSISSFAANWSVAAIIWTGTAFVASAAVLASAAPITVAGAVALGFHAGVAAIWWPEPVGNPLGNTSYLTVQLSNDAKALTPTNWTPPLPSEVEPTPPSNASFNSGSVKYTNLGGHVVSFSSIAELQAYVQNEINTQRSQGTPDANAVVTYAVDPEWDPTQKIWGVIWTAWGELWVTRYVQTTCPSGYSINTVNGLDCEMTTIANVKKPADGQCEIFRINGLYQVGRGDPDCDTSVIQGKGTSKISVQSADSAVVVTSNSLTGTSLQVANYSANTNKTQIVMSQFDSGGVMTSQVISYLDGLNLSGTGGTTGGTTTGSTTGANCGGVDQQPCAPSGFYGRTGTTTNFGAPGDVEGTAFDKTGPMSSLKTFTDGLGVNLPSHASECPVGHFDFNGQTFTIDSQCTLANQNFGLFSAVFHLFWLITGTFIVLRA